jgi:hypothetical protein
MIVDLDPLSPTNRWEVPMKAVYVKYQVDSSYEIF